MPNPRRLTRTKDFVQTFQRLASVTIGIDSDLVPKLSGEQAIDRYVQPLSLDVPESRFDAADGVIHDARHGTGP